MLHAALKHAVDAATAHVRGRDVPVEHLEKVRAYFRKLYLDMTRRDTQVDDATFIYVCHHPADSQLVLRARQYRDQVALCRLLASNLPAGATLLVKEHPVYPGMLPVRDVRRLQRLYPSVRYVDYSVPFSSLVKRCRGVIVINSTAGLEAAIHGVPVVVLGDCFYDRARFVRKITDLADLTDCLKSLLVDSVDFDVDDVEAVLAELVRATETAASFGDAAIVQAIGRGIRTRLAQAD
jgi:hypothetical protein